MKGRLDSNFLPLVLLFNVTKLYPKTSPRTLPFMSSKNVSRERPEFMNLSRNSFKSMPKWLCEEIFGLKSGLKQNGNVSPGSSVLDFFLLPLTSYLCLHLFSLKVPTVHFIHHLQCPALHIKVPMFIFIKDNII